MRSLNIVEKRLSIKNQNSYSFRIKIKYFREILNIKKVKVTLRVFLDKISISKNQINELISVLSAFCQIMAVQKELQMLKL